MSVMIELNNGMQIPDIGMGTFPYNKELITAIPEAYKLGYRMFDTSDNYGNEEYVGKALNLLSQDELDNVVLITKYSQPTKNVQEVLDESKKKMSNKSVDILLMHWPYPYLWEKRWQEMEDIYKRGEVRAIGVCNFTEKYLNRLIEFCEIKPTINQFECHPMFQQINTIDLCKKEDIQVMSYSPLARMSESLFSNSVLVDLAKKYRVGVEKVILRWNIQNGYIPIPASKTKDHLSANINIFDFELTGDEINKINELECGMRIRYNPDTRFDFWEKMQFFIKHLVLSYFK